MPQGVIEFGKGLNEHDLARVRGGLTDDFVLDDHRLAGMGHLAGPEAYVESVAALLTLYRAGKASYFETFEVADLENALARFEELRA